MVLTLGVPKSSTKPELSSTLIVGVHRFFLELAMTCCLDVVGPRDNLDFFRGDYVLHFITLDWTFKATVF